jgi:citrate lyase gamma subunit
MKVLHRSILSILVAAWVLLNVKLVGAQAGVEMELSASYQFGEHVTFTARLISPLQVQKASIFIHDSTQVITHAQPVTFNDQGISEFRFDTRQNLLRPFTTVLWRYELTLADGSVLQSATGSIRYDDDRFAWQTLPADPLHIHWYQGDDDFGTSALNAAQAGIQNIRRFFEPDLSQPVDIFIYANEGDLRGTLYGAEAWVAGHADTAAGVVMVTIEPGSDQGIRMEQRIPHELMHVLFLARSARGIGTSLPG